MNQRNPSQGTCNTQDCNKLVEAASDLAARRQQTKEVKVLTSFDGLVFFVRRRPCLVKIAKAQLRVDNLYKK